MAGSVSSKRVTVGGVVSLNTVTVTPSEVNRMPSRSRATAVNVCEPLPTVFVSQGTEYDAVVSSPMKLPST